MPIPDVVVVGGGVIGAASARALAIRGLSVSLIEPGPLRGAATDASAGLLAPLAEATEDDPMLSLKVRGRDHYADLVPSLEEETGIDLGYWTEGILNLAFTEDKAAELRHAVAWQRQLGFAAEWLVPEEVHDVASGTANDVLGASMVVEDGAIDPAALRAALLSSATFAGIRIRARERVTHLEIQDGHVQAVRTNKAPKRGIRCGAVVIAAGCWSGRISGLPRPLPVEPVRGQMIAVPWPTGEPRAVIYGAGAYTLHRAGEALVGATVERVGFSTGTTKSGADGLLRSVRTVFPSLTDATPTRKWAGLRPMTTDGQPLIGKDPEIPNLVYATGHGRAGIMMGSLTGDIVRDLVLQEELEYDLTPANPQRFWDS